MKRSSRAREENKGSSLLIRILRYKKSVTIKSIKLQNTTYAVVSNPQPVGARGCVWLCILLVGRGRGDLVPVGEGFISQVQPGLKFGDKRPPL
jgi:hypothetical protein